MLIGPSLGDRAVGGKAGFGPCRKSQERRNVQVDPIIEESHPSSEHCLVVIRQQVSKSQPRGKITLFSCGIPVEAKTQIHGESRKYSPLVLYEESVFVLINIEPGRSRKIDPFNQPV